MGDEGKAVGSAQAPAALLLFHDVLIRSVITITERAVSSESRFKACFVIFAAIRRASALLIVDFEFGSIARKPLLLLGKSVVSLCEMQI